MAEAVIDVKLDAIAAQIEKLEHRLFGNGQPGKISEIEERITGTEQKVWMACGGLALLGLIATLSEIWYHAGLRPH